MRRQLIGLLDITVVMQIVSSYYFCHTYSFAKLTLYIMKGSVNMLQAIIATISLIAITIYDRVERAEEAKFSIYLDSYDEIDAENYAHN